MIANDVFAAIFGIAAPGDNSPDTVIRVARAAAAHDIERIMRTPPERLCALAGRTPVLRTDRADMGERWAAV